MPPPHRANPLPPGLAPATALTRPSERTSDASDMLRPNVLAEACCKIMPPGRAGRVRLCREFARSAHPQHRAALELPDRGLPGSHRDRRWQKHRQAVKTTVPTAHDNTRRSAPLANRPPPPGAQGIPPASPNQTPSRIAQIAGQPPISDLKSHIHTMDRFRTSTWLPVSLHACVVAPANSPPLRRLRVLRADSPAPPPESSHHHNPTHHRRCGEPNASRRRRHEPPSFEPPASGVPPRQARGRSPSPLVGSFVTRMRARSTLRAHSRPSLIAHTTSD